MNTKAIAKRQENAVAAPQQQRHLALKDLLESPTAQTKLAEYVRHGVKPQNLSRLAMQLANKDDKLNQADPMSVLFALTECARLGLEPGGRAGGAYLIARWDSKSGRYRATVQTDYRGEITMLRRGKVIIDARAHLVYANERFEEVGGLTPNLIHEKRPLDPNRGELVGCYGVLYFAQGLGIMPKWLVLTKADVENRRARSESWKAHESKGYSTPWATDKESMWLKTAIRAIASKEPVDVVGSEYAQWSDVEERRERGEEASILDDEGEVKPPASATEELEDALVREMDADRAASGIPLDALPLTHPDREPSDEDLK